MKTYKNVEDEIFEDLEIKTNKLPISKIVSSILFSFILKVFQSIFILMCSTVIVGPMMGRVSIDTIIATVILGITGCYIILSWIDWLITRIYIFKLEKHVIGKLPAHGVENLKLMDFIYCHRNSFSTLSPTVEWVYGKNFNFVFSSFIDPNINNYIKQRGISKYSLENIIWNILGFLAELSLAIVIIAGVSTWLPDTCPSWVNISIKSIGSVLTIIMLIRNWLELMNFLFNNYPPTSSWIYGRYENDKVYMHPFWKFLIRIIRFFIPCPI